MKPKIVQEILDLSAYAVASGTNTYIASIDGYTLQEGKTVRIKFTNANTGASTLNINDLGAKNIIKGNGSALASGNIKAGQICNLVYDGLNFQLLGEGGEYGTATASDVLKDKTIGTDEGIVVGTLTINDFSLTKEIINNSGDWTAPEGVDFVFVMAIGGGGAGGKSNNGGGGGGHVVQSVIDVRSIKTLNITIGAGATANNASGGSTIVKRNNVTLVTANGGSGAPDSTTKNGGAGGAGGGSGSSETINAGNGGDGAIGSNGSGTNPGSGSNVGTNIFFNNIPYGGAGGGGGYNKDNWGEKANKPAGNGGNGGGGNGGVATSPTAGTPGGDGTAYGAGGGGSAVSVKDDVWKQSAHGKGYQGAVIFSYYA